MGDVLNFSYGKVIKAKALILEIALCKLQGRQSARVGHLVDLLMKEPFMFTRTQVWIHVNLKLSELRGEPMP